ncbi:hypothetical protein ACUXZZ_00360 [Streptomyces graminifolii]|uniref:hypothetical protein n=1 Tax=Streptomyces graminifolii TaxID=1266771 RepID=UPI0040593E9E
MREGWRASAIRAFGVDVVLAAVDNVAVVYVMRGAFTRHHLLAEASRYFAHALRGRPHQRGLDDQIVQAVVDDYIRPVGRGRVMTADLRAGGTRHGRRSGKRTIPAGAAAWLRCGGPVRHLTSTKSPAAVAGPVVAVPVNTKRK